MVEVRCDNERCSLGRMIYTDTDSRQEWKEEIYECPKCRKRKVHRTEFDQLGLVIKDEVYDE